MLLAEAGFFILAGMTNLANMTKQQLLDLVAVKKDTIKQLQAKLETQQRKFLKLWQERFGAKSERYIADPDQLKIDFGDTLESADAAEGLHQAVAESQQQIRSSHSQTQEA